MNFVFARFGSYETRSPRQSHGTRYNITRWTQRTCTLISGWSECVFTAVQNPAREITFHRRSCWISHTRQIFRCSMPAQNAMLVVLWMSSTFPALLNASYAARQYLQT